MTAAHSGEVARAYLTLTHATAHARVPCTGDERDLWAADHADDRAHAARLCGTCPALAPCARYADLADERWHVWGGVDRQTQPQPPRQGDAPPPTAPAGWTPRGRGRPRGRVPQPDLAQPAGADPPVTAESPSAAPRGTHGGSRSGSPGPGAGADRSGTRTRAPYRASADPAVGRRHAAS